jgi:hypothetical protein
MNDPRKDEEHAIGKRLTYKADSEKKGGDRGRQ